jgi:hypothetical protein
MIKVKQKFGDNSLSEEYFIKEEELELIRIGNLYWANRLWLYKNNKPNHVAHINTLTFV